MAEGACAGTEPSGSVPAPTLGLLLSQMSSRRAFPGAAELSSVMRSASALHGAVDLGPREPVGHYLTLSPGLVRLAHVGQAGRSGGGVRGVVTGFSASSRRQMLATLGTLDLAAIHGIPLFVTLTYPGDWRAVCPSGRVAKQHLDLFRRRWSRRWGPFQGVWKMEFQPRSRRPVSQRLAPHFHLLAVVPNLDLSGRDPTPVALAAIREWTSNVWWDVVGSNDPRHLRAGTQVLEAEGDSVGRIVGYFAGYTAGRPKEDQHTAPDDWPGLGRYWGVSGIERIRVDVPLCDADFFMLRRLLAEVMARRAGRKRRRLRNPNDGLWLAIDQAPDLVRRLSEWLISERSRGSTAAFLRLARTPTR